MNTKFNVFVTGVVSGSLGKGITAASLEVLLKNRDIKLQPKFDPYINVTEPYEHGEVFCC